MAGGRHGNAAGAGPNVSITDDKTGGDGRCFRQPRGSDWGYPGPNKPGKLLMQVRSLCRPAPLVVERDETELLFQEGKSMKRKLVVALVGLACLFSSGCVVPPELTAAATTAAVQFIIGNVVNAITNPM